MCKPLQREAPSFISHDPVGGWWKKGGQRCEGRITQNIMTTFSHLSASRPLSVSQKGGRGAHGDLCACAHMCEYREEGEEL